MGLDLTIFYELFVFVCSGGVTVVDDVVVVALALSTV